MKKKISFIFLSVAIAFNFGSCYKNFDYDEYLMYEEKTKTETTETTTEYVEEISLTRGFTFADIYSSVVIEGIEVPFPIETSEFFEGGLLDEYTYENKVITSPNGGSFTVNYEDGKDERNAPLIYFEAKMGEAPTDFSVYGLEFGMSYKETVGNLGIPNYTEGSPSNGSGSVIFYGDFMRYLSLEFEDGEFVGIKFFDGNYH